MSNPTSTMPMAVAHQHQNPLSLPFRSRTLKRSASTASIGSLPPTPPRTHRKHARGRSRGSCDSDSEDDALLSDSDVETEGKDGQDKESKDADRKMKKETRTDAHKSKKRKTSEAVAKEEEAFWAGGSSADNAAEGSSSRNKTHQKAPLLYRRMLQQQQQQQAQQQLQQQTEVAPVSPPPSHRRPTAPKPVSLSSSAQPIAALPLPAPTTPRTRSAVKRGLTLSPENPLSESPENPFLATPLRDTTPVRDHVKVEGMEDSATPSPGGMESASGSSANPSPHAPGSRIEKATVTYVFRGVRRVYQNPMYNHASNKPYSPPPASKLPIDHPDYSPDMNCAPKLLFPAARRSTRAKASSKATASNSTRMMLGKASPGKSMKRARSPAISDDEDDLDAVGEFKPQKLDFGVLGNNSKKSGKMQKNLTTLEEEFEIVGERL